MESPECDKVTKSPNSSDSVSVQDSPIFSYISKLSPIKPLKAPVAQGFPGLNSPSLVFTSPQINPQCQSGFLKRPQCPRLSSAELPQQDVDKDNTNNKAICESEKPNIQLYSESNPCTDKEHGNNGSEHNKGGSPSGCFDEYFTDILVVDSHDSGHLANLSLKQSDNVPTSSKKAVAYNRVDISKDVTIAVGASPDMLEQGEEDCQAKFSSNRNPIETNGKKGGGDMPISSAVNHASDKQRNEHSKTVNEVAGHMVEWNSTSQLLQESMQLAQEYKDCGETNGAVSSEQNVMLYDSKASQRQCGMRRRCLQFEEAQQNNMENSPGTCNQSNTVSNSKSPTSPVDLEVLESSCADIAPTPSTRQLENRKRPILSTFPTQNYGNSSLTVSKPSGIGLHLNSIVNAMPMQCSSESSASITSVEGGYINIRGKKSFCITSCHLTDNARSSSTSSNVVENLSVITEENQYKSHVSTIASSGNPSLHSLKPLYDPVLSKNPIDHHLTPGDKREPITEHPDHVKVFPRSSPRKKRKKTLGSNDGDGCKRCNCKKSKCLKLYCDCFAAGIYCADPCSCQGCFNRPEYEDTVLETRQQIESRNPLAFAPKVVTELAAESTRDDINHSTPSSARHKRGCNCKKSMCLKKYCECYQSNVGCSDGCRCEGCKNVFGTKEEYVFSKDNISKEATNERSAISFDEKLEKVATRNDFVQAELCCPHNLTPLTPLFQCSVCGKDALKSWSPERYLPSQQSDRTFFTPHGKPPGSPINSDNQDTIRETSKYILDVISFDQELCYGNSERVDDFSSHELGNIDPLSAQQNSPSVMAMTSLLSPKTRDWTRSPQFCPGSGPFSSISSLRWRSTPITPTDLFGEAKPPRVFDSDNGLYNKIEDEDTPEILKDNPTPITAVKVSSPNKKRVSPPHSRLHELGSSSSAELRSGRKFILRSVPSFPPLTPCIDVKGTTSQLTNDHPDCSNN